ncbi:MAG: HAMP domain-containing protein [Spirochaetes bacterium]|nr:HAMP domain-containing protein [Spirochaetota bacterium]
MIAGAKGRRRIPEIAVVSIIYLVSLISSFLFLQEAFRRSPGLPDFGSRITAILLALLPLAFLFVFFASLIRSLKQAKHNEWGSRLRLKLIVLFVSAIILSAGPPSLFMSLLTLRTMELPATAAIQEAIDGSFDLALAYYSEQDTRLETLSRLLVPQAIKQHGPDAAALLRELQQFEPAIQGVEIRSGATSLSFAGNNETRTPEPILPALDAGFLARLAAGNGSWSRFMLRTAVADGTGQSVAVIIAMRYPDILEESARTLSIARTSMGSIAGQTIGFGQYLVFFITIYIVPLFTLALLFALAAGDMLLRPINSLEQAFRRVRSGLGQIKLLAKHGDEAGLLVESFNSMLDTIERSRDDELRNEKIGIWRDIARRLAHELRNPLTPIKLSAERVLRRYRNDPTTIGEILEKSMIAIVQETSNMENLLGEFQDFARLPEAQKNWLNLAALVQETVLLYSASYPSMHFEIGTIDPTITVKADRGYLKQAFGNLLTNAADATDYRGLVEIRADLVKTADSRYCRIQLRDNGHGIPAALAEKIFSPYFTTKKHGTGLGLAVVEHVVNSHGGTIRLESSEGLGTVFYIDLPAEDPPAAASPGQQES